MLDTTIHGATVFDGQSSEPRQVTVGLRGDRIVHVGDDLTAAAERQIDAHGLFLCPGFIDTHASTGLGYTMPRAGDNKLFQGVTTEIIGNCGTSTGPIGPLLVPTMERLAEEIGFTFDWRGLGEWFDRVEAYGLPFNIGTFVGHSTLRAGLCEDHQQVTHREIEAMGALLDEAGRDGSLGLSTGLVYAPGSFAETAEIITLARLAAAHGGIYVSHIRDERQDLEASIEETFEIARGAGIAVLISHLKSAERPNWGKIPGVIRMVEDARHQGLEMNFEVYPYTATSTKLRTFLPKAIMADGVGAMSDKLRGLDWRQRATRWLIERGTDFAAMRLITASVPNGRGRSLAEIAADRHVEPSEATIDVLLADPDAWIVYHCIDEEDMEAAILWPDSIICSDSWSHPVNAPIQIGNPHPRTFGAFTRFLERYALTGKLDFGHAVRKITSLPADWLRLKNRGRIAEGFYADLVLLEPASIKEKATFEDPRQFSEGTERVWVNGTEMLADGEVLNASPGRVLRGGRD